MASGARAFVIGGLAVPGGQNPIEEGRDMKNLRKKRGDAGFTMVELMIVVLVVGVLAAIAVPLYGKYIKNARITEATAKIGEILTACKSYAQSNPNNNNNPTWPGPNSAGIDLTPTDNFTYGISTTGGEDATTTALTITATGQNKMAGPPVVTVTVIDANINTNAGSPQITGL